jgi:hypothetical protein
MAESKYAKYIVTEPRVDKDMPSFRHESDDEIRGASNRIVYLDDSVIKGALYSECAWFWPGGGSDKVWAEAHTHDFDEVISFFGTDYQDPHDLCGEVELWLEDEQFIMTRSFLAYIPAGMKHCPLYVRRVDRPIFHFTLGPGGKYG